MNYFAEPLCDVLKALDTSAQKGLNQAQFEAARAKYGKTSFARRKRRP